jgi:hypothetical protein
MRTKTNILLAAMAFADVGCMLCALLPKMMVFVDFATKQAYNYYLGDHVLGMTNCFSAASATDIKRRHIMSDRKINI